MRRWLFLLFCLLLLAGAFALNRVSPTWHYLVPVTPGAVAYANTFESVPADWTLYSGRLSASVEAGRLILEVDEVNQSAFSLQQLHWSDIDLTAQAQTDAGPADNGYGLIVRLSDKGNASPNDDDYYLFLISSDGFYRVVRSVNGLQRELSTWIPSAVIRQGLGVTNTLRVLAQGDQFRFVVNGTPMLFCVPNNPDGLSTFTRDGICQDGQMVDTLIDTSIPAGRVGVVAQAYSQSGVVASFDHVILSGP
ncbi:MAG TPA: hypothetical protein PLQ56_16180 [Aggregatilineales bacterium]|nr:hypothetical protein [Anaerolineae bacterium]HUN08148.1 hypothetical protein [Aggregatilineales bacterium]